MLFSWYPPAIPNGEVISYTITYNLTWLPVSVVVSNTTRYLVTGLDAYEFYEVTIFASTIAGRGPATLPLVLRTDVSSKYMYNINAMVMT